MHHKQNNITACVAGGSDTLEPEQTNNTLVDLIYSVVSHCTHRVKGEGVVRDLACWVLKAPREWGRDRGCCGGRAEETIQARSRPQAAGAEGGSPPPPRPRHLAHKIEFPVRLAMSTRDSNNYEGWAIWTKKFIIYFSLF